MDAAVAFITSALGLAAGAFLAFVALGCYFL